MKNLPEIEHLGPNFIKVLLPLKTGGTLALWYSYGEVIGFAANGKRWALHRYFGRKAMSRHRNLIKDAELLSPDRFNALLAEVLP